MKNENKKEVREIFYYITSWIEDEGDFQPTQEEAEKKVKEILTQVELRGAEFMAKKLEEKLEKKVRYVHKSAGNPSYPSGWNDALSEIPSLINKSLEEMEK